MRVRFGILGLLALMTMTRAAVVEHYWDVTWVWAAPDDFGRSVIGINGHWPCPNIFAAKGDEIVVHVTNKLGNQTTGIHWHGISQVGTNYMDGSVTATQCPLSPNTTTTYRFIVDQPGTFWWHSHDLGQYPDGIRGALIVSDDADPFAGEWDEEYTLTLSDWYHDDSITVVRQMLDPSNTQFFPPLPDSMLLNDGLGADFTVDTSKNYRFRIINMAAFASFMLTFGSIPMTVIMNDASYINREEVSMIRLTAAQRCDVLIKGRDLHNTSHPFLISMDVNPDYTNPDLPVTWGTNATGHLIVEPYGELGEISVNEWLPADDSTWQPLGYDTGILPSADHVFPLDFRFCFDVNGVPRACFDDNMGDAGPYVPQKVPTLYTAITTGEFNTQREVYGHVHPLIIHDGDVVDLVVNNHDGAIHPFHLHGHHFQVLERPGSGAGVWPGDDPARYNDNPPMRDTVAVHGQSYAVLRFKADNPGVYLFHCHVEWHVEMGLTATVIEAPDLLRNYTVPQDHLDSCRALGIPYEGNAGGNTIDFLDSTNFNTVNEYPYDGPTVGGNMPTRRRKIRRSF